MGWNIPHDCPDVAAELGTPDAVFRVPGGHSQGDLHDERHRIAAHVAAPGDQDQGIFSESGGGDEVTVSGAGAHCQKVDHAGTKLESRLAAFCDFARRPGPAKRASVNGMKMAGRGSVPPAPG